MAIISGISLTPSTVSYIQACKCKDMFFVATSTTELMRKHIMREYHVTHDQCIILHHNSAAMNIITFQKK